MTVAVLGARLDRRALALLARPVTSPRAVASVQAVSHLGDHAAVWLALGALGVATDTPRRPEWTRAAQTVLLAHATASMLKRAVRRSRPPRLAHVVSVSASSRHSFPSSHATSSGAALVAFTGLVPAAVRVPLAAAVCWSRLALAVHYPSDVFAGLLVGAAIAHGTRRTSS